MSGREDNNRVQRQNLTLNGWYLLSLDKLLVDDVATSQIWKKKKRKSRVNVVHMLPPKYKCNPSRYCLALCWLPSSWPFWQNPHFLPQCFFNKKFVKYSKWGSSSNKFSQFGQKPDMKREKCKDLSIFLATYWELTVKI